MEICGPLCNENFNFFVKMKGMWAESAWLWKWFVRDRAACARQGSHDRACATQICTWCAVSLACKSELKAGENFVCGERGYLMDFFYSLCNESFNFFVKIKGMWAEPAKFSPGREKDSGTFTDTQRPPASFD